MKTEISAGGIIVRTYRGVRQVLMVRDMNGAWTFPKGKIEKGETRLAAALREISEEVGLHGLTKICLLPKLRYVYKRNGSVDKTVYYFLFQYDGKETPVAQAEEGLSEASWFPFTWALKETGYPDSNTPLLIKAQKILETV